jgi:methyltransferase-like protein
MNYLACHEEIKRNIYIEREREKKDWLEVNTKTEVTEK